MKNLFVLLTEYVEQGNLNVGLIQRKAEINKKGQSGTNLNYVAVKLICEFSINAVYIKLPFSSLINYKL